MKLCKYSILKLNDSDLLSLVNYHFERLECINKHRNLSFIEMCFVADVYEYRISEISLFELRESLVAYLGCLFRK